MYTRRAVEALRAFREQHRFMRGVVAWLGLKEAILPFHRPARIAGETKYPVSKLIKLAWTAISSSSAMPLKVCSYLGALLLFGTLCAVSLCVLGAIQGWSSTATTAWVAFLLALSGLQMCAIGLLGDYVGRVFEESKQRPLYVVSEVCNLESMPKATRALWLDSTDNSIPVESTPRVYGPVTLPKIGRKAA